MNKSIEILGCNKTDYTGEIYCGGEIEHVCSKNSVVPIADCHKDIQAAAKKLEDTCKSCFGVDIAHVGNITTPNVLALNVGDSCVVGAGEKFNEKTEFSGIVFRMRRPNDVTVCDTYVISHHFGVIPLR